MGHALMEQCHEMNIGLKNLISTCYMIAEDFYFFFVCFLGKKNFLLFLGIYLLILPVTLFKELVAAYRKPSLTLKMFQKPPIGFLKLFQKPPVTCTPEKIDQ